MNNLTSLIGVQLIQVTLCIAAAALLSLGLLRRRPALAAAVWIVVLCKCATPPIWASPLGVFSWLRAEQPRTPAPLPSWIDLSSQTPRPQRALAHEPPVASDVVATPSINWPSLWPWLLTVAWVAGFTWTFTRAFRLRRRWLASVVEDSDPPASLIRAVAARSERLKMTPPRIVMVAADAGPAASGWFRPTIYLPIGADPKDLESMLVHELVHLRRRDPWLGALQALVCAAYWFHPAVRWASDELSRCIEEACDADTVRELGCRPAEYAAALVALLERRVAPPVPMVAGMTPAKSVRRRLETVMKTNPHQRGPSARGPWLAFAAATLIALPGAGLPPPPPQTAPPQPAAPPPSTPQPTPVPTVAILPNPVIAPPAEAVPPTPEAMRTAAVAATTSRPPQVELKNFGHHGYDLKPAIDVLVKHCGLREDAAGNAVANLLLDAASSVGPRPVFTIANQRLFAFAAEAQHQYMAQVILSIIEVWTDNQIIIETEIWDVPKATLDAWTFDGEDKRTGIGTSFLTDADYQELSKRLLSNKAANRFAAPRVTAPDGQDATLKIAANVPLGSNDKDGKPLTAPVGVTLELAPNISADGKFIKLKVCFRESTIGGYVPLPASPDSNNQTQTAAPIINASSLETTFSMRWDVRTAIKTNASKLLVFKCKKAPRPKSDFNLNPPADDATTAGADFKMRAGSELLRRRTKHQSIVVRVYPVAHFLRGPAPVDQQMSDFSRALNSTFVSLDLVTADSKAPSIIANPQYRTLTVAMTPELHDALARMIRDVDPRTDDGLHIPQEYIGIQ